jgi:small subunit ribosomal protein S16
MALKIRLRQQGRNNRPFYRLVVADARSPRDGRYVETLGWYNPFESQEDKSFLLQVDRIQHWLSNGAQLTESAEALIRKGAPAVIRQQVEKEVLLRAKEAGKRKARKKTAAS